MTRRGLCAEREGRSLLQLETRLGTVQNEGLPGARVRLRLVAGVWAKVTDFGEYWRGSPAVVAESLLCVRR